METNTNTNKIHIAIDADSLVFKSCYRCQINNGTGVDIERAYMEFCYEIGKIKSAVFRILTYNRGDVVVPIIVLSPRKSFRNKIWKDYKANRPDISPIHGIRQLKYMIVDRLKPLVKVLPDIEADDIVIFYARKHNIMVSAIDKDVIHACPTSLYNYNKRSWNQPNMDFAIEEWYWIQAMVGDTADNIPGAKGMGEERAREHIEKYGFDWERYVEKFEDEYEALLSMQLVRMDQLEEVDGVIKLKLWTPETSVYVT